jgi:thymidylate kinase
MSYKKGMFIVLEGIDGAGKSAIGPKLKDYLENQGHNQTAIIT